MSRDYQGSLSQAWQDILEFNDRWFPGWRDTAEVYWTNALAGEVGELCNAAKKRIGGGTKGVSVSDAHMAEERADVFIYLMLMSQASGFDLEKFLAALAAKMDVNEQRMRERTTAWDANALDCYRRSGPT